MSSSVPLSFDIPSHLKCQLTHVAMIMDGNRRWAKKASSSFKKGYEKGAERLKEAIAMCQHLGIPLLTAYVFSENQLATGRNLPFDKDDGRLPWTMCEGILLQRRIKLSTIGDLSLFSSHFQNVLSDLKEVTTGREELHLVLALNYGGRDEMVEAVRSVVTEVAKGCLKLMTSLRKS